MGLVRSEDDRRVTSLPDGRVRLKFFESINDCDYLLISINACTSAANNRLCYSDNAIKGRVQWEMICPQ